jgi:hypothetical protein
MLPASKVHSVDAVSIGYESHHPRSNMMLLLVRRSIPGGYESGPDVRRVLLHRIAKLAFGGGWC